MKKSKLFLFGLLTAILAGALVLAGCEGPQGPAGPSGSGGGASLADLAAYGFAFGTPVHNVIGRGATYPDTVYGTLEFGTATAATTLAAGNVLVVYGNNSVRFTVAVNVQIDAFKAAFNNAIGKSNIPDTVAFDVVASAKTSGSFVAKVTAPTTDALTITFSAGGEPEKVFGSAGTGFEISSTDFEIAPTVAGLKDKWTVPIVTSDITGDKTSASSTVTLGSVAAIVRQTTDFNDLGSLFEDAFDADDPFPGAVAGYEVDGTATAGLLVFEAADAGVSTKVSTDFIPVIGNYAKTDIGQYGYAVTVTHTSTGAVAAGYSAESISSAVTVGNVAEPDAATTWVAGAEHLIITYQGKSDTTILPARSNGTALLTATAAALLNTTLTGVTVTVSTAASSEFLTLTESGPTAAGTITVGGSATALTDLVGTATASGGVLTPESGTPAVADVWTVTVIGGGATNDLIPTVASKVTITPAGVSATPIVTLIEAGETDIAGLIETEISNPYNSYVVAENDGVITLTLTPGAGTLTGLTATVGPQYN